MRIAHLIAPVLIVLFLICTYDHGAEGSEDMSSGTPEVFDPWLADAGIFKVDIVQRTCALEVVVVLRDIEERREADRAPDAMPIPMDVRPSGAMLACTGSPAK